MIGDRLDNDICPAKKMGMYTIWAKQGFAVYQQPDEDSQPDYTVESLSELKEIF